MTDESVPPGKEAPTLDVGHGLPLARSAEGVAKRLVIIRVALKAQRFDRAGKWPVPIALQARLAASPRRHVPGRDLPNTAEHRSLAHHGPEAQRLDQCA